jgi:Outer membrane protein beta-barrel domain
MRNASYILVFFALAVVLPSTALASNVDFVLGQKSLEKSDWDPVDHQFLFGAQGDLQPEGWPIGLAYGALLSIGAKSVGGVDLTGTTVELRAGARKVFLEEGAVIRPYIGGGIAMIAASLDADVGGVTVSDDDVGFGPWFGGGVYFAVSDELHVGLDISKSQADVTLFDVDADAGGVSIVVLFGLNLD